MRLKELREAFHLSAGYVERYLGISDYETLENGERDLSDDEAERLSVLYGVPTDKLVN